MSDLIPATTPEVPPVRYGVIYDEPIEAYHANPAVSKTKLDVVINTTPELYHATYIAKTVPKREESTWAIVGNAAGALILEGADVFAKRYAVEPQGAPRRPTQKQLEAKTIKPEHLAAAQFWSDFDAANAGKTLLSEREDYVVRQMHRQVFAHPLAAALLSRGRPEVTMRFRAAQFDVQCRFDWVCLAEHGGASPELVALVAQQGLHMEVGQPYAADLKTTANLSDFTEKQFDKSFPEFCYHRQGPFYRQTCLTVTQEWIEHFFFIAVEKADPFAAQVYLPTEEADERGWNEVKTGLSKLDECKRTGIWPGLPGGFSRIGIPGYYKSPAEKKGHA